MRLYGHIRIICIATSLAMTFSMVFSSRAFADGSTDTPPATEETALPPVEEPGTEEATPPVETAPIPEENNTVSELLSQIPDNTDIIVTVENEVVPLASTEAAEAILIGDPIWCPDGQSPTPGANGCTGSYTDLESLIDDFDNSVLPEPNQNGTIWIMAGNDASTVDLVIDGSVFTTWSMYSLTLQGGWDGSTAGTVTGSSIFSEPISVLNWGNHVVIHDISIDGALSTGLEVETSGNITLEDVSSTNNGGYGAALSTLTGDVTLNGNNTFNNNLDSGLYAEAGNDINAQNLTANNNDGYGAELYAFNNATLTGSNTFDGNTESGLYIEANQDIQLQNLTGSNNGGNGAELYSINDTTLTGVNVFTGNGTSGLYVTGNHITVLNITSDNNSGYGSELYGSSDITLNGNNFFDGNTDSGLFAEAGNNIYTENLAATNNDSNGAELYSINNTTLTGNNIFTGNGFSGLYVEAGNGINTENITANNNDEYGSELHGVGDVSVNGNNTFNDNADSGLLAEAGNNIYTENLTAFYNDGAGTELYSINDATLTGNNIFIGNGTSGLYVEAGNHVVAENITADNNMGYGSELYSFGDVTVTGTNQFNNNDDTGLFIETDGSVAINNITANGNVTNGAEVYASGNMTLNGVSTFSNNGDSGLYAEANGAIYAENITADGNGAGGIYGAGVELYSQSQVTVSGTNRLTNNYSDGIYIAADGNIYVQNTDANGNGFSGIYVESAADAEITCGVLSGNAGYEIEADLAGTLTLNGVDFGGDIDGELGVDEDQLVLNSNSCFTYNFPPDEDEDSGGGNTPPTLPSTSTLPIHIINGSDGQAINLDCGAYRGTLLILSNGDGAYIPCPIIDSAQIFEISENKLPSALPTDSAYLSSFLLTILKDGQELGPLNLPSSVWYTSPEQILESGAQVFYWNGVDWIDATSQITPFMEVFFEIPDGMKDSDFAILYWDGKDWIELSDTRHLGNGYIVKTGGHMSADGVYFEATVNFTGTFVLVKK